MNKENHRFRYKIMLLSKSYFYLEPPLYPTATELNRRVMFYTAFKNKLSGLFSIQYCNLCFFLKRCNIIEDEPAMFGGLNLLL